MGRGGAEGELQLLGPGVIAVQGVVGVRAEAAVQMLCRLDHAPHAFRRPDLRDGHVAVRASADEPVDATVRGSPLALLGLLRPGSLSRLRTSNVELTGKVHVAEEFAEMLRQARPDLEGELAGWVGDIAAHEIGTALLGFRAWAARARRSLEADVADFLQHERAVLPAALEARAFFADVERLRDDVERAERRLEALARRTGSA